MQSFVFKYGGWIIGALFIALIYTAVLLPQGLVAILFFGLIIAYFVLRSKRSQYETGGKFQFSSDEEQYAHMKEEDPTIAFIEKALKNGDFKTFDKTFGDFVTKFKDKPEEAKRNSFLILRQTSKFAPKALKGLLERGEVLSALQLIDTFKLAGINLAKDKEVLDLLPMVKETLKTYLETIQPEATMPGFLDSEGLKDIIAVLHIKNTFEIPDSFFEEPGIFALTCKKVAGEINRYFSYKNMDIMGVSMGNILPTIPEKILNSPEVKKAVENRLRDYIKESKIEDAKKFAQFFHYKDLSKLVENS